MASEGINTAILVIAGVLIASLLTVALLSQVSIINNVIAMTSREVRERISTSIDVIYVALNTTNNGDRYIVVFVKNIGGRGIALDEVKKVDVYVYDSNNFQLYTFDELGRPGHWNFTEVWADNVWSIGETLIIYVYNTTSYLIPFNVRITLPNSVQSEYMYSG